MGIETSLKRKLYRKLYSAIKEVIKIRLKRYIVEFYNRDAMYLYETYLCVMKV